jgi:hypothetical protein
MPLARCPQREVILIELAAEFSTLDLQELFDTCMVQSADRRRAKRCDQSLEPRL